MVVVLAAGFLLATGADAAWRNGHPSKVVILNETFQFANGGNIFVTDAPTFGSEMLIVPDRDGNRVVVYKTAPAANDAAFDFTIEGADAAPNNGLNDPLDAGIGPAGQLLVVDRTYNRVLVWNTVPATKDVRPDFVLGQANFAGQGSNRGDNNLRDLNTFASPEAVAVFGNKLLVVDAENHRVLIWNTFPTADGQKADVVVGQTAPNEAVDNVCDAVHTNKPRGLAVSPDGKLLVGNQACNRVMIWNSIPTTNGKAADFVLGQPNLNSGDEATTATGLRQPIGVSVARDGKLAVADKINDRVLIWNSVPTENGKAADFVLGQRDMVSSGEVAGSILFEASDVRSTGRAMGVEWTADGRLWVMGAPSSVRLFDPNFAPEIVDYVKPMIAPKTAKIAAGDRLMLTVQNGKAPFEWRQVPTGQENDYYGNNPCSTVFDAASATLTAGMYNKHQWDNFTPQLFSVKDAKGNLDTAEIVVYPRVEMSPQSQIVYSGISQGLSAWGGVNTYGEPYTFELVQNQSGGTVDPADPSQYRYQPMYTPGPNPGVDIIAVRDKEGHEGRAEFQIQTPLTINEANGAPTFSGNVSVAVGQTFTFTASGGSGTGFRFGNYNDYYVHYGTEYGNGRIDPETGRYTAKRVGQDQVYVNDSVYNAYTINVTVTAAE